MQVRGNVVNVPIYYECSRCTACCRWPGEVRLTDEEIDALAQFKGMAVADFVQQFTRVAYYRHGLVLTEKPNGACIFLEGKECAVQRLKPRQCRDFPNRWHFSGFQAACQAIPRQVTQEEYDELVAQPNRKFAA